MSRWLCGCDPLETRGRTLHLRFLKLKILEKTFTEGDTPSTLLKIFIHLDITDCMKYANVCMERMVRKKVMI
jgi:hypothetical protein